MTLVKKRAEFPVFGDVMTNLFEDRFFEPIKRSMISRTPAVNIFEEEKNYTIQLAAPGFKKEDFSLDLENNRLTVSASVQEDEETSKPNYTLREFNFNTFSRVFNLPKSADQNQISAKYEEGILSILIGKKEEEKKLTTKIEIQ